MISSWLTLRDLEYLTAVAKHEHFGKAARECHVSQPSLSTQIKKIEGYLGVSLFERTNRRVKITETGQKIANQAHVILEESRKIESLIGASTVASFAQLKLGIISSLTAFVPHVLIKIKKAFPTAQLTLKEGQTDELVKDLKTGALDAVIAADTVRDKTLRSLTLFFEPFVLAAPRGSPVLDRVNIRTTDLKLSEMVLLEEGHCLRDQVVDFCPTNKRGHLRSFNANSIETLRHLVASGAGYTLLPQLAVKEQPIEKLISYRTFENKAPGRDVVVLYRAGSQNLVAYDLLIKTIAQAAPKELI